MPFLSVYARIYMDHYARRSQKAMPTHQHARVVPLPKLDVAGSIPVSRSIRLTCRLADEPPDSRMASHQLLRS